MAVTSSPAYAKSPDDMPFTLSGELTLDDPHPPPPPTSEVTVTPTSEVTVTPTSGKLPLTVRVQYSGLAYRYTVWPEYRNGGVYNFGNSPDYSPLDTIFTYTIDNVPVSLVATMRIRATDFHSLC